MPKKHITQKNKTVLILGGGIGGVVVASRLRKALPREHRIVLIDQEPKHLFSPSLLWLMLGQRTHRSISRPLINLEKRGIEWIQGEVEIIDPAQHRVQVKGHDLVGDYMVIALGAKYAPEMIPGLEEAGCNFYSLAGAEALREARLNLQSGRLVVLVSGMPFKCPAAPHEAAMLLEYDCRKRQIRDAVQIDVYTPEPGPMTLAGPQNSAQIRQMLEQKGIAFHPKHQVAEIDAKQKTIHFNNGSSARYDLLAYVPPHRAPDVVRKAGLIGESGWVPVDRSTLETKYPGVFAIGDVTGIGLSVGKPLPKAGVFAHGEAEVVANNLVHAITGKGHPKEFAGHGECFLETGDGKAGLGSGNFFAEPAPAIKLRMPGRMLHFAKVAFEKYWLFRWF
ncbi:MAG: NAD(P)/FAD-dependent oxidoreductase [Gammaproteobacteria bacterium]|nr:NAD(P)/FAD-dependent oxidoreductase [Gammaproteobacteria bacterium]